MIGTGAPALMYSQESKDSPSFRPPIFADPWLAGAALLLVGLGLIMIYSVTALKAYEKFGDILYYVKRQGAAIVLGLASMIAVAFVPLPFIRRMSGVLILSLIPLLLLPLIPGLGHEAGGATRWIRLPFFQFQPSELVKLFFAVGLAAYYARREHLLFSFTEAIVKPFGMAAILGLLLAKQQDFGSTAIITAIALSLALVAGVRFSHLVIAGVIATAGLSIFILSKEYRLQRLMTFFDRNGSQAEIPFQVRQSLIAFGNGGPFGVGIGNSHQKLSYLPEPHTDFIYAMIGEELGFAGAVIVVLLFGVILYRSIKLALSVVDNSFAFLLTVGSCLAIVLPGILNLLIVLDSLPTKGLALPFVSYGGSSMVASLLAIGILLAVSQAKNQGILDNAK